MGDIINGYELISPFQNKNAGFSRWTFARKNGEVLFIKEFLSPIYPMGNEISTSMKNDMIGICSEFYKNKYKLYGEINKVSDGNLLRISDFFRWDSHYYIVTEKIENENISFREVSRLPWDDKLILCKSIAHSMMMLEKAHIVHSDIKADNIILKRTKMGKIIGKIIDFDSSFFEDTPPENEDDLGCDQVYLSPEALKFICGESVVLSTRIDTFAMGILFHEYLTGEQPRFSSSNYGFAAEALLDGSSIEINPSIPKDIRFMLQVMLKCESKERPPMSMVYDYLDKLTKARMTQRPPERTVPDRNYSDDDGTGILVASENSPGNDAGGEVTEKVSQASKEMIKNGFHTPGSLMGVSGTVSETNTNIIANIKNNKGSYGIIGNYRGQEYSIIVNSKNTNGPAVYFEFAINNQIIYKIKLNLLKTTFFGRAGDNDVVINEHMISRRHFALEYNNRELIINDLNSSNGTFLNGVKLTHKRRLEKGDVLRVGIFDIRVFW